MTQLNNSNSLYDEFNRKLLDKTEHYAKFKAYFGGGAFHYQGLVSQDNYTHASLRFKNDVKCGSMSCYEKSLETLSVCYPV